MMLPFFNSPEYCRLPGVLKLRFKTLFFLDICQPWTKKNPAVKAGLSETLSDFACSELGSDFSQYG